MCFQNVLGEKHHLGFFIKLTNTQNQDPKLIPELQF